ncbi:MAG TPA: carboxylesterase family protein, partial [Polyangiales bacterium]
MAIDIRTSSGVLRGAQRDGHQVFLGIPYAAPPVGSLRFAAPQPAAAWTGMREAVQFGNIAPQQAARSDVQGVIARGEQSEDCLYLNVYTPAADGGRRPVLFWIHGGGFIVGSSSETIYDGGPLATRGDVVLVSVNYRLGALGYLYLGGHGGDAWGAAANAGQLDQIAALRWVRDNIAQFGGDPRQVTIFGESAGSAAVCALLAMPAARGLFARAIGQSGTANRLGNPDTATGTAHALLAKLGLSDANAEQLRTLPVQAILDAQTAISPTPLLFSPIVDGVHLPERPLQAVREGQAKDIPLLIGTNRDESKFYMNPKRSQLDADGLAQRVRAVLPHKAREAAAPLIETYRASRASRDLPHTNNDILDAIETAARFAIPASRLADAQSAHQPATFVYLFDWESPAYRGTLGACHALELSFVFGTTGVPNMDRLTGTGPAVDQLSHQMMDAWLAFAKTG